MKKRVKKVLGWLGVVLVSILLIGVIGISIFTGNQMIEGAFKMNSHEQTRENGEAFLKELGLSKDRVLGSYEDYREEIIIEASKGDHQISATYVTVDGDKKRDTVILVHGHGGDKVTMYPLAKMFLDNGFNVLAYDQRQSGYNTAEYTTFGYLESEDLQECVDYVKGKIGTNNRLGILGQSMGGATTGFYAGKEHANNNVDFIILDGPFNDMYEMIESVMADMNTGVPVPYLMFCGSMGTKFKLGFFYQDMNVANSIEKTTVPVLMIHSKADKVCPYEMGETIYDAIPHDNKAFYTQEAVPHIMGFYEETASYTEQVMGFIEKYTQQ